MIQTVTKPIDRVLDILTEAVLKGEYYQARCRAHDDHDPSLSFGTIGDANSDEGEGVVLTCFAGCSREAILDALHLTEHEMHYHSGSSNDSIAPRPKRTPPLTLMKLALNKLLRPKYLMSFGVDDGESTYHRKDDGQPYQLKGVKIPYYTADGKPYGRYRMRKSLTGKNKIIWNERDEKAPLPTNIPYGLWKLDEARKSGKLIIVEGESDCWTLWQFGFASLGIPGATNYKCVKFEHIKGIAEVFIMNETDEAGEKFPINVKKHLNSIGYKGKIYALDLTAFEDAKDPNDLHLKLVAKHGNIKSFQPTFEKALLRAVPLFVPGKEPEKPAIFTLKDLMAKELKPPKWVIPDYLPEGLFLLAGKPKLGKSWLGFDIALGVSFGGWVMGKVKVEKGEVLYMALEDNERRIQKRMGKLLGDTPAPDGLHMVLNWNRVDKGGAEDLENWIKEHPQIRLVIVDTWTKLSPRITGNQASLYEAQYDALVPLKAIADRYAISIMAIHHNRKMGSDDVVDEISGSTGLTGSVDGFWIIKRERGQTDAVLHIIGRDIEEEQALAINFDASEARWKLIGNAEDFAKTRERQEILDLLKMFPIGLKAREITEKLGNDRNHNTVRNLLVKLREEEKIVLTKDTYTVASDHSQRSQRSDHSQRSQRSQGNDNEPVTEDPLPDYANAIPDYGSTLAVVKASSTTEQPILPVYGMSNASPDYADYAESQNEHKPVSHALCCTIYEDIRKSGPVDHHQFGQRTGTAQDDSGHWWCEQCIWQHDLMNIACILNYPKIKVFMGGKEHSIDGTKAAYLRFAQMEGYNLVKGALQRLEQMQEVHS